MSTLKKLVVAIALALVLVAGPAGLAQTLDTLPGGIVRYDDYRSPDGFYAFWPVIEGDVYSRDSLGLVVFTHGYGGLNPVNYGAWVRHIVEQRQVVVYPRYQRNLLFPRPRAFAKTHHAGVTAALRFLDSAGVALRRDDRPIYVGHSYGGTLTAYALAKQDSLGYPPAFGAVLAAPGTNRLKGSRLGSYHEIDPRTQLVIVTHANDVVVGDEFAELVYRTVPEATPAVLIAQRGDGLTEGERLSDGHNECYALDEAFDSGYRNFTTRRALRIACEDALDRELYWPLVDEMIAARKEDRPHEVFRNQTDEISFGRWSDGTPRAPLSAKFRSRAAPLPLFARLTPVERLEYLSERHDYVPPPQDVNIPFTLEEMLQTLSVPAEYEPRDEQ